MNQIFNYWNSFVLRWIHTPFGPSYLYNTAPIGTKDYSKNYIPEPWWSGNRDCEGPLYSVCLNLNPGKGEYIQTRRNTKLVAITSYQDVFALLPKTNDWHRTKRAQPIINALKAVDKTVKVNLGSELDYHLSVELIPWHTQHATNALGYWSYVKSNIKNIFDHSFMFAAEESNRITAGPLQKTVLMRFSESTANQIFKLFNLGGLISSLPLANCLTGLSDPNVHATIFTFPNESNLSEHRFVAIWRSKGWRLNDFPNQQSMEEILRQL